MDLLDRILGDAGIRYEKVYRKRQLGAKDDFVLGHVLCAIQAEMADKKSKMQDQMAGGSPGVQK